ncbi:MAG TPA: hypothetical protein VM938_02750 [Acidimicrobiales bacterium]|nr:hypothetical protein [Acidimicrobiales bacterium]
MRKLLCWMAVVAAGEFVLLALGDGLLAAPNLTEPATWPSWLVLRGTDVAVLALVRLAALWAGAYLLAALAVGTVSRALRCRPLIRAGDVVTPPFLRAVLDRAMGVAAAGSVAVASFGGGIPPAAAEAHERPPTSVHGPPITLRGLDGPRPDRAPTTTTAVPLPPPVSPPVEEAAPPPPATVLPPPQADEDPASPRADSPPRAPEAEPEPMPMPPAVTDAQGDAPVPAEETWTVRRGDSFWVIAEQRLADTWGRAPSAREIDPYWRALVEANRFRLADPGNPDLLFAGQVLAVPPPPAQAA